MNTVKVAVSDLLRTLYINRDKHIQEFNDAMVGYREALVNELQEKLILAQTGKDINHNIKTVRPVSYEDSYNEAIAMMEWTVDKEVELDRMEFKQYVQDEWTWKNAFSLTASMYSK